VFTREGGSIPIVNVFHDQLGVDTLLLGWDKTTTTRTAQREVLPGGLPSGHPDQCSFVE